MTLPGRWPRVSRWRAAGAPQASGRSRLSPAMRIVVVAALGPPALYLARGLLLQSFEPLARFALVPGALLLPLAATAVPPARARAGFASRPPRPAVAFSIAVWLVATVGRDRIWAGAESMGALTRLDGEDRALARWLRAHRRPHEPVMIEPLAFADIGIAHAAGVPWTESITLIVTREPRADRRGQHARDRRALPRRLRSPGRTAGRAACPTGPAPTKRHARGRTIRPLAGRQSR